MTTAQSIQELLGTAPEDLVAYFERGPFQGKPGTNVKGLPLDKSLSYTRAIHERTIIGRPMGLFALNDSNDSNPYCYVSRGPCAGAILHLHHGDSSAVAFRSLASFLAAVTALKDDQWMDDIQPGQPLSFDTAAELARMAGDPASDFDVFAPIYLRATTTLPDSLKASLAGHSNFFVREAFAWWLQTAGTAADLALAQGLATDKIGQVADAAKKALPRIQRLAHGA
ncbi:MAG: hypothetical protein ACO1TE_19395 [Prosthecobacter sp.]